MNNKIIKAKLSYPEIRSKGIPRDRLFPLLRQGLSRSFTLISAGPGWGKTSLLSGFFSFPDIACAWYELDADDRDPSVFLKYLAESIHLRFKNIGEKTLQVLRETSGSARSYGLVINTFLNEVIEYLPEPVPLVIEDFHHIETNEQIEEFIVHILKHAPPNLHLYISSRTMPRKLLDQAQSFVTDCTILAEDLAFDKNEIDMFFKTRGYTLTPDLTAVVLDQTGGWPMGLQALIGTFQSGDYGTIASNTKLSLSNKTSIFLFNYLETEIIRGISPETRRFLEFTAVPARFNLDLAAELTDSDIDSASIRLEDIRAKDLFLIEKDEEPDWYKYHALFRTFLLNRLKSRQNADTVKHIQRKTASWLMAHDMPSQALTHALKTEEDDLVLACFEQAVDGWIATTAADTLLDRIKHISYDLRDTSPKILFGAGWANYCCGRWNEAEVLLKKASKQAEIKNDPTILSQANYFLMALKYHSGDHHTVQFLFHYLKKKVSNDTPPFAAAMMMTASSLMYMNRPDHALDLWTALKNHPHVQSDRKTYLYNVSLMGPHYYLPRGDFDAALEHIREAIAFFRHHDYMGRYSQFLAFLGQVRHELGDFSACRQLMKEAAFEMASRDMAFVLNAVYCALAINQIFLDDTTEARRILEEINTLRARCDTYRLWKAHYVHVLRALLAARDGNAPLFHDEAEEALSLSRRINEMWDFYQVACWLAHGLFILDQPDNVVSIIEEALSGTIKIGAAYGEARCRLLLASAELDLGHMDKAQEYLVSSLKLCGNRRYDALFLARERQHALKLFPHAISWNAEPAYFRRLALSMGSEGASVIRPLLNYDRVDVRARAARLLGELGDRHAERDLVRLSQDTDSRVHNPARKALSRIKTLPPLPLHITMFGSFRVRCGEREIPRGAWRRSQAKSIFKYLLFHRDIRVSSETLMDIFFTDMDPDRATDALYKAISFLRSVLEPGLPPRKASSYLESDDRSYRMILPSGSSLDIIAFEKAVDRGSIAFKQGDSTLALSSWATALEAYRGDFLQEDPLEEWTALPRERFQASLLQILKEMARLRYARFDYNAARDLLQRILEKDEWDEQSYLLMMKAHLALGQRARAVEVYLKCRDCLKRDLNIEPDGTLTSLYRELFPGSSQRAHET